MKHWIEYCQMSSSQMLGVASATAGRLSLEEVIGSVSDDVQPFLSHDHFDAALLTEDSLTTITFETGLSTEWGGAEKLVEHSPIRELLKGSKNYIVTDDAQDDPRFRKDGMYSRPIFEAGLRSRLHVSIKISGSVIGALSFSRTDLAPYQDKDIANAIAVSQIIGPYIHGLLEAKRAETARQAMMEERKRLEGLRRGARHLADQIEKTQSQIGMDLHDQTLADLTRITRSMEGVSSLGGGALVSIKNELAHCVTELRNIVEQARPSVLELFGLPEAIRQQVDKNVALHPLISVEFVDNVSSEVWTKSCEMTLGIFRIAQEAITNAYSHSQAGKILITITDQNGALELVISDNGTGIKGETTCEVGGLFNMRTRAILLGATLAIESDSSGTRIVVRAEPLAQAKSLTP